jgi:hypothetical protein
MPSKQRRFSTGGRPPRGRRDGGGKWMRIFAHWASDTPRHAMIPTSLVVGDFWRQNNSFKQVLK